MDKELEDKIINDIENSLTEDEARLIWYLRKNNDNKVVIRLSNALKNLYNSYCDGIIRVYVKYALNPEEKKFLESIKGISEDKLRNIKNYMIKLFEED